MHSCTVLDGRKSFISGVHEIHGRVWSRCMLPCWYTHLTIARRCPDCLTALACQGAWFGTHINSAKGGSLSRMHRRAAALAMGRGGLSPRREIAGASSTAARPSLRWLSLSIERGGGLLNCTHGHEKQCRQSQWRQGKRFGFDIKPPYASLLPD